MRDEIEKLAAKWREEAVDSMPDPAVLKTLMRCARDLEALLAADAGGWRSMDSAPRDGTRVLISRRGRVTAGRFCDDSGARKPKPYWHGGDADIWGIRWARATEPDGWMPLPTASAPQEQEPPR
jgi:hypothetical protein